MKSKKLKMRKLVDRWTPAVLILFCMVKILQTIKNWWGIYPKHSGWRSAMNAFSRTEHSKFSLAVFHLDLFSDLPSQDQAHSFNEAKDHLAKRLYTFLKATPETHWEVMWKKFKTFRRYKKTLDVVLAHFGNGRVLLSINPYLDPDFNPDQNISEDAQKEINAIIAVFYNQLENLSDKRRPFALKLKVKKWILSQKHLRAEKILNTLHYADRILSGIFIHFEKLLGPQSVSLSDRFINPAFIKFKHPGHGLMNIHCRLTHDCKEADLWFQFHHVPVDGVPMQEMLNKLKMDWGTVSELTFPEIKKEPEIISELCSTDKKRKVVYQAKQFINYRPFLEVRKKLNKEHSEEAGFSITAVGMLLWGLSHHKSLRDRKFMFTVEMPARAAQNQERSPGLVIIRPSLYFDKTNPRTGFLKFQHILAERIEAVRERRGETYELMEAYALATPLIYKLVQKIFPKSFSEFVGTVGITMIRDSDYFTGPVSDVNTDGFLAFGNFSVPTECGGRTGVVTVRGTKSQVHDYLSAVSDVASNFTKYC